ITKEGGVKRRKAGLLINKSAYTSNDIDSGNIHVTFVQSVVTLVKRYYEYSFLLYNLLLH
ncbi:MAG TPA: hypothetical protein VJL79_04105, partial [Nitrososphaera sp.]|nr:hypothetical protein [Nitrososphaera sp.]